MSRRSPRQGGFTLIEVLVALVILSLAVVACIEAFAQGLRLLTLAGAQQRAALLADQKVREVVDLKEGQDQGTEGPLRWERRLTTLEAPDLVPSAGTPQWKLYQIEVRVGWERRVVEVRTLRMVPIPVEVVQPGDPSGTGGVGIFGRSGAGPGGAGRPGRSGGGPGFPGGMKR